MLVLSRRNRESVIVGDLHGIERKLKVTVLAIGDGKVSLGFDVANDIPVHRSEIWEQIRTGEQRAPAQGLAPPSRRLSEGKRNSERKLRC